MSNKEMSRATLNKYGDKVLVKAMRLALDGNVAMIKYVLDRYFSDKIKLEGNTPRQLVDCLISQSKQPGVTRADISSAVDIIRVHIDAVDADELEKRISKMEKHYKKKRRH